MYRGATEEDIHNGLVTDVYFERTRQVLEAEGMLNTVVRMEFVAKSFSDNWEWAVLAGVNESLHFLKDLPVTVRSFREGEIFYPGEPIFEIKGRYSTFLEMETPLLGFLSQASGIATRAARCKIAAEGRVVASFGSRRMHPAIAPMIDHYSFIGGCDGVSTIIGAQHNQEEPTGTMPHSLVLLMGDVVKASVAYDRIIDKNVPRVVLVDGLGDERFEAIRVAKALGTNLQAIRLDTPSSRRGSLKAIAKECRWELDQQGFQHVKIFATGNIGEKEIQELNEVVDGYGVGGKLANAPTVDMSANIVEIDGVPTSKRGVMSGAKQVWVCDETDRGCGNREITPLNPNIARPHLTHCRNDITEYAYPSSKLKHNNGTGDYTPRTIREYVLWQIKEMKLKI